MGESATKSLCCGLPFGCFLTASYCVADQPVVVTPISLSQRLFSGMLTSQGTRSGVATNDQGNAPKNHCNHELNECASKKLLLSSIDWSFVASSMESPQHLLPGNFPLSKFLVELCHQLEVPATDMAKKLCCQRKEALALVSLNISHSMRHEILSTSLRAMSARVLADMPQNESRSIFQIMNQEDVLSCESFAYLLVLWLSIDHPGNTSSKIFGNNLLKIFRSKCLFLPKQIMEAVGWSSSPSNMQARTKPKLEEIGLVSAHKQKYLSYPTSSSSDKAKMQETYRSSERKLQFCFPGKTRKSHRFPKSASGGTSAGLALPMDFMSFFHKAIKKDLELLVIGSAKLAENTGCLMEFRQHFQLLQLRHRLHSDAEAGFFFPALEAKENQQNTLLDTIDHELEFKHFSEVSLILDEMFKLQNFGSCAADLEMLHQEVVNFRQLSSKLGHTCQSLHKLLCDQLYRRETELRPLFREYFSIQEQEKIIASILGRTSAETLQDIIPWLVSWLTSQEQQAMMSLWRKITKSTMFDDWLGEWWEENGIANIEEDSNKTCAEDGLVIVSRYLSGRALDKQCDTMSKNDISFSQGDCFAANIEMLENCSLDNKARDFEGDQHKDEFSNCAKLHSNGNRSSTDKGADVTDQMDVPGQACEFAPRSSRYENLGAMNQDDLEANIRRVSSDSSLDPQMKSQLIQNLLMSRWLVQKQSLHAEAENSSSKNDIPGQHPSYRDPLKQTFGCKHYKRNCKLLTTCCNQLYTCIRCHDEEADHPTNRRMITKMMCMKCLVIQPITQKCSTLSCNSFSMAKYYCSICKLFDDADRKIYHCPYCNLCRVGKGLGVDYFHCMNCNACMSQSLSVHICREKCFEDNCPICHEHMFTSSTPVKALPCGHLMHSTCFKDYTCTHYICPICSKSLGDMQVYFQILDEMLAEEKIPEEYSCKTQTILCNDCEKKGSAPFHWVYHKCPYCGSYNTRLF